MDIVKLEKIEDKIIIRNEQVLLDSDVAGIYGVETKRINEAVKNNPDRLPDGNLLEMTEEESENLKSKFSISSWGGKRYTPKVFTERGLYMLATILKSGQVVQTTLAIIETFAKIRNLSRNMQALSTSETESEQKDLMKKSGEIIAEILDDDLETTDTETTVELNLALLKFKHTIKKKK